MQPNNKTLVSERQRKVGVKLWQSDVVGGVSTVFECLPAIGKGVDDVNRGISIVLGPCEGDDDGGKDEECHGYHEGADKAVTRNEGRQQSSQYGHHTVSERSDRKGIREALLGKSQLKIKIRYRLARGKRQAYFEMLKYHPGFKGGEEEGSGDTGQQTAEQEDCKIRHKFGEARQGVDYAECNAHVLSSAENETSEKKIQMLRVNSYYLSAMEPMNVPNIMLDVNPAINNKAMSSLPKLYARYKAYTYGPCSQSAS